MRTLKALVLTLPTLVMTPQAVSVLTVGALVAAAAPAAYARDTVSAKVGKPLQDAQKLVKENKLKDAMAKIEEADALPHKTPYEQKTIDEFMAFVAIKMRDYRIATKAYEGLLNSGTSTPQEKAQRLKALTQLTYQIKDYGKAETYGKRYLKEVGPDVDIALLVAQSYYLQKDYKNTVDAVRELKRIARAAGQSVKENWLQLEMSSLHNLKRDSDATDVLQELLASYPSKQYWHDMLILVGQKTNLGDRGNVELYRLKEAAGVIEPDERVDMAELSMAIGLPGTAESDLEQGFKSGQLGQGPKKDRQERLLSMAKKRSADDQKVIDSQEAQAAKQSKGDLQTKVGEAYMSYGEYDKAIDAIKAGLKKGGVEEPDLAQLHLGQAYFYSKKYSDAVKAFKAVPKSSKYSKMAQLWAILAQNSK